MSPTPTTTPVVASLQCPMAHCRFEHTPARSRALGGRTVALPGGALLASPDTDTGAFGVDRAGAHLVGGHSLADWIREVIRLRAILADPDHHVAAARELQQLALARARQAEAERDAAREQRDRALAECEQLRARLAHAERGTATSAQPVPAVRARTTPAAPCPVCERPFLVRIDGRIRLHNMPGRTQQTCSGSGAIVADPASPKASPRVLATTTSGSNL